MSIEAPRQKPSAEPSARPVELHADLYREIFAHSKEAIAIIDPEGFYLQQNGAHFTLLGYPDEDLKGRTLASELEEATFGEIEHQLALADEFSGEIVCRTKNGEAINVELSVFTMRSGLGEPLCYVCIKRDITRRKHDELALRRMRGLLQLSASTASRTGKATRRPRVAMRRAWGRTKRGTRRVSQNAPSAAVAGRDARRSPSNVPATAAPYTACAAIAYRWLLTG